MTAAVPGISGKTAPAGFCEGAVDMAQKTAPVGQQEKNTAGEKECRSVKGYENVLEKAQGAGAAAGV